MAAVTLQRELDAYSDAIDKYNQQARSYKTAAATHNASVDAYKASFVKDPSGEIALFFPSRTSYIGINSATGMGFRKSDPNYTVVNFGGDVALQYKDKAAPKPGEFTKEQPTQPGAAPSATTAQIKKLNQPSLTDVERTGGSGLISSAFNY